MAQPTSRNLPFLCSMTTGPTRREFLLGAVAAPLVAAAARGRAVAAQARGPMIVNTLGSLADVGYVPFVRSPGGGRMVVQSTADWVTDAAIADTLAAGVTAVNQTVGHVAGDVDPFEFTMVDIEKWDRVVRDHPDRLLHVRGVADIERARGEGKIGVIYGFQNSLMLGDEPERVARFFERGVRIFQLTYNGFVPAGDGALAPGNGPLTAFGHEVIERLNAAGALVDLAHSGERTCLDAIRASRHPVLISHSGCRALVDLPRNKSDAELRALADRGGYVGIYFMMFLSPSGEATPDDVVAHIDHAVNVCGEDHVGIGTDGSSQAIPDLNEYLRAQNAYLGLRRDSGVAAPGEVADKPFFVVDLAGPGQFRALERLLRRKGYGSTRIEKILGRNFLRVAGEVWGA